MTTSEHIKKYDITIKQPKEGYRYSEDSFHLLGFIKKTGKKARALDIGAGSGIISLAIARKFDDIAVIALEIEPQIFHILTENIVANNMVERVTPLNADYRVLDKRFHSSFDIVVTNPPYRAVGTGRISVNAKKAEARHETAGSLRELIETAGKVLKNRGRLYIVYLCERMVELLYLMRTNHIEPKTIQPVYPNNGCEAGLILVEGVKKGGAGLKFLPPVFRRDA